MPAPCIMTRRVEYVDVVSMCIECGLNFFESDILLKIMDVNKSSFLLSIRFKFSVSSTLPFVEKVLVSQDINLRI